MTREPENEPRKAARKVDAFFDELAGTYDEAIARCVPRYCEMLEMLVSYLPDDLSPARIADLGAGTGSLSRRLASRFPDAELILLDVSRDVLDRCRVSLGSRVQARYQIQDMRSWRPAPGSIGLAASSIAIHHLTRDEKKALFQTVFESLEPGGVFAYCDQFAGVTEQIYAKHLRAWCEEAKRSGVPSEEWEAWMEHQAEHDHHESLPAQMEMLRKAGFAQIDCPWRYLLWTVLLARKPS